MKQGNVEKIERINYLLEMGIDFQSDDLEIVIGGLKGLSSKYLDDFNKLGIGKWVHVSYFDKHTKTIKILVEKELFC